MIKKWLEKIFWSWDPQTKRESNEGIVRNMLLHWFPAKTYKTSISWSYSLWLGTASAVVFLVLCITGVVLMFLYVPSVERAYPSIKDLETVIPFGTFIRSLHRVGAHLMVILVFCHMLRVFFTGAYRTAPDKLGFRYINWVVGVFLLLLTLFLSFTGYLLPWDQLAYWAISVGTNIAKDMPLVGEQSHFFLLGGTEIGQNTLLRFYILHCFILPVGLFLLFCYHMWRIRKDGGLACTDKVTKIEPVPEGQKITRTYSLLGVVKGTTVAVQNSDRFQEENLVPTSPTLTTRILCVLLLTLALSAVLALIHESPLEEPANPAITPHVAKAPWYFLWLQELVADTTVTIGNFTVSGGLIGGIVIPGFLVTLLILWPLLDRSPSSAIGVWFHRSRIKQNLVFGVIVFVIILLILVGVFMRGPNWRLFWPWEAWPMFPGRM
jgi:quinol-cytochrome oxidoreductase complex cytochrome b subunit